MRLYKQYITVILLHTLLMVMAFTACTRDDIADDFYKNGFGNAEGDTYSVFFKFDTGDSNMRTVFDNEHSDEAGNDDFVHGSENEHKIGKAGNYALFFDQNKKFYAISFLTLANDSAGKHDDIPEDYIEACYGTKFIAAKKEDLPRYCMVILNGQKYYNQLEAALNKKQCNIDSVLNLIWEDKSNPKKIGRNDQGLFVMTNSSYAVKGQGGKDSIVTAVKIDPDKHIISVEDDSLGIFLPKAKEEQIIHVHVERMLAKCSFKFDKNTPNTEKKDTLIYPKNLSSSYAPLVFFAGIGEEGDMSLVEVKDWQVKVTGWNINALERKSHLFKNINEDSTYYKGWNAQGYFRSYWSEDPDYTGITYPWQYRKAIDINDVIFDDKDANERIPFYSLKEGTSKASNSNTLMNYSFNELKLDTLGFDKIIYIPENTYDKDDVAKSHDSRDELLAGTHLLIGGELQINDDEKGWRLYDTYRDRSGLYYYNEKECFLSLIHSFNQLLMSQEIMKYTLYDWDKGGFILNKEGKDISATDTLVAKTSGEYMLCYYNWENRKYEVLDEVKIKEIYDREKINEHEDSIWFVDNYGKLASANLRSGDGKRLPWIEGSIDNIPAGTLIGEDHGRTLTIRKVKKVKEVKEGEGERERYVIDETATDHRISIHKKKTKNGKDVAEDEILWYANENDFKSLLYEWLGAVDHFKDGKMYYALGVNNSISNSERYGVVRNNWYQFNLKEIQSIGIPVDNPDQPIVPEKVKYKDQINVKVEIIGWHTVETEVPLF